LRVLRILLIWKEELKKTIMQVPKNIAENTAIIYIEMRSFSFISLANIVVVIPVRYVKEIIIVSDILARCF